MLEVVVYKEAHPKSQKIFLDLITHGGGVSLICRDEDGKEGLHLIDINVGQDGKIFAASCIIPHIDRWPFDVKASGCLEVYGV